MSRLVLIFVATLTVTVSAQESVEFPDAALESAIRNTLYIPSGPIPIERLSDSGFESLTASSAGIKDLSGIEHCISLKKLDLSFNGITNIQPLASLTSLETLTLNYNTIKDLSPVANLTGLQNLGLMNNLVSDFTPLSELISLQELYCGGNTASNVEALRSLTRIEILNLSASGVSSLDTLNGMSELRMLNLQENKLYTLDGIEAFPKLVELDVRFNLIGELAPLFQLTELKTLNLVRNPLNPVALCEVIPALQAKDIQIYFTGMCEVDIDADGLADDYENMSRLDPTNPDCDEDGLWDGEEIWAHHTDPNNSDTDGDGMPDGFELESGLNALVDDANEDADGDGVINLLEYEFRTNPTEASALPKAPKLVVEPQEFTVRSDVPWAPFKITNAGQLELKWRAESNNERVRVVNLPTQEMATLVASQMPSQFWGLTEVGTDVSSGTGDASLYVLGTDFERPLVTEVTITNTENPAEKAVLTVRLAQNSGAEKPTAKIVVSPPEGGTVFQEPVTGAFEVKLGAVAAEGYRFVRWDGPVDKPTSPTITIIPEEDAIVIAVFEQEKSGFFSCAAGSEHRGGISIWLFPTLMLLVLLYRTKVIRQLN